jgi:putative OPT family oligopeptide transporter
MAETPFKPYVPASESPAEFTFRAVVLGALFGLLFGASTVYLGLRAGLTVSASIPIAVLAISVLKRLGGSTILENNIVQTIGSAGESLASGVVFTIPALIFLLPYGPAYFNYLQILLLAFAGGILGVLMMVPLRRALIVKEHGVLPYPEGTACADVLVAGERGGALAGTVFMGLAVGSAWKALSWIVQLFRTAVGYSMARTSFYPNATLNVDISPEYMGVGYVIGPRIAGDGRSSTRASSSKCATRSGALAVRATSLPHISSSWLTILSGTVWAVTRKFLPRKKLSSLVANARSFRL